MKKDEFFSVDSIENADFDFECCEKKDVLLEMLEKSKPIEVEKFNSKNTNWNLWGEFDDYFKLYINDGFLETSTCSITFIDDFLQFLPQLAYTDDKKLICPFEYEGIITAFVTTPIDKEKIRISVFNLGNLWERKFNADIIIKKDTFLKQIIEILQKMIAETIKENDKPNCWVCKINYILGVLDKYFENPQNFKNEYETKRHIKVFDVAYKTLEGKWLFEVFLEKDVKANIMHWQKEKNEGKILDFDFFEQYSENLYIWNKEYSNLIKLTNEEIRKNLKPDMDEREERNWVYSAETKQWYSENEVMPYINTESVRGIYNRLSYEIKFGDYTSESEDSQLETFINHSYDKDGNIRNDDDLGYLTCVLTLKSENREFAKIKFNYRNYKQIRTGLEKVKNGEYCRFDTEDGKLHMWQQLYYNSKITEAKDILVACFRKSDNYTKDKEIYAFNVDKKDFLDCFVQALDEIEYKLDVTKRVMETANKLKLKKKFNLNQSWGVEYNDIDNFIGGYACVNKGSLEGWGIINKNLEWIINPEYKAIEGETHPKLGTEIKGFVTKYTYLHNIDGKLFIASRNHGEEFIMDINGDIQIPHVAEKFYYKYIEDKLYFIAVDKDTTVFINQNGKKFLQLDFQIGEKFWLFEDIIIVSKDEKYGIIDWKGKILIDFIFSDIKPDENNLDFIPVKYLDMWGYINKKGKVINMKIKDTSKADEKCSKVEL